MTVLILATGGTIASLPGADGSVTASLSGAEVLASVPGLDAEGLDSLDVAQGPSWNVDAPLRALLALAARDALVGGRASGVVITHGTDTVEETLWLTELLAGRATDRGAIVFACAMRHAAVGADGPRNLLDAVSVARHADAAGRGAMLCANGELHAARWVTKTDTTALSTFRSPATGPIGRVGADGRPRFVLRAPAPPVSPPDSIDPAVAIVVAHDGVDGAIVDWHLERGTHGLVVQGTGAGNVNQVLVPGIERAMAAGIPVVVTSRCATGPVARVYGGAGGGANLGKLGVIPGGDLGTVKAQLALMVALAVEPEPDAVRAWFGSLLSTDAP